MLAYRPWTFEMWLGRMSDYFDSIAATRGLKGRRERFYRYLSWVQIPKHFSLGTLDEPPSDGMLFTCAGCGRNATVGKQALVVEGVARGDTYTYATCWTVFCDTTCERLGADSFSNYTAATRRMQQHTQFLDEMECLEHIGAAGKLMPVLSDRLAFLRAAYRKCEVCGKYFTPEPGHCFGKWCSFECKWWSKIEARQAMDRASGRMGPTNRTAQYVYPTCVVCGGRCRRMRAVDVALNPMQFCMRHKNKESDYVAGTTGEGLLHIAGRV